MLALYLGMIETPEEKIIFEELYNTYKGKMFSLAFSILKNHHNAEEAVSQAFFTAAKNFSKISSLAEEKRGAYLKIIVKNAAIDIYRKEKSDLSQPLEEIENLGGVSDDVSDEVLSKIEYETVVEAIRALPEQYAETLYLFHVRDLSVKEVSEQLHAEPETIKKRLQRARQKLKEILAQKAVEV